MAFLGRTIEYLLHLGAKDETFHFALALRKSMTESEKALWEELRNRKMLGLKFRRQHPLHWYVADFYCHEKRLVIEIDGGVHNRKEIKEHDLNRTAELERLGIRVIRFTNEEILSSKEMVLKKIIDIINIKD
jgi:very-short-patch-repair endonuclease